MDPIVDGYPSRAIATTSAFGKSPREQHQRASAKARCNHAWKKSWAEFLSGNRRESLDVDEYRHRQQQEERSPDGIVDFHAVVALAQAGVPSPSLVFIGASPRRRPGPNRHRLVFIRASPRRRPGPNSSAAITTWIPAFAGMTQ